MSTHTKVSGSWKEISEAFVKVSGAWKNVESIHAKVSGSWKEVFASGNENGNDDYTVLLLHGEGTDGSTVITDSSRYGHYVSSNGNAQIDTGQFKLGKSSIMFDGSGDYLAAHDSEDWAFGSGDFTFDWWMNISGLPAEGTHKSLFCQWVSNNDCWLITLYRVSGVYYLRYAVISGGSYLAEMNFQWTGVTTGTWYHCAIVRTGNNHMAFVNGTQIGSTVEDSYTSPNLSANLVIGIWGDGSSFPFYGWTDEIRISKGIARWTSNFTPPTGPYGFDYYNKGGNDIYTKLLLHGDGWDGSTAIVDDSWINPKAITVVGNAQIDTAQSKFGGGSILLDGTGDYLTAPDSDDWYFGTGDFTIDTWIRFNALPASGDMDAICSQYTSSVNRWRWGLWNDGGTQKLGVIVRYSDSDIINVHWAWADVATDTWYHIALVRSGNDWMMFVNGAALGASQEDASAIANYGGPFYVGSYYTTSNFLNGWLDEFRISKGIARWTAAFTPPSKAYYCTDRKIGNDPHTKLLLKGGGIDGLAYFQDASWHNTKLVLGAGNAQVDTAQSKFGGSSILFDGTDDNVYIADNPDFAFGAGDFTVDFWVRFNALPSASAAMHFFDHGGTHQFYIYNDAGQYKLYISLDPVAQFSGNVTLATGTWYHWALVRSGSSIKAYLNGQEVASTTSTAALTDSTGTFYIGVQATGSWDFNGWMDEFRISKGIARWTANFSPPAKAYA